MEDLTYYSQEVDDYRDFTQEDLDFLREVGQVPTPTWSDREDFPSPDWEEDPTPINLNQQHVQ